MHRRPEYQSVLHRAIDDLGSYQPSEAQRHFDMVMRRARRPHRELRRARRQLEVAYVLIAILTVTLVAVTAF